MNDKNMKKFFGNEDESVIITLTDEDGMDFDVELLASFEIEELGSEYIAAMPIDENGENPDAEVYVLKYTEDENGEAEISSIDDEEEESIAGRALEELLSQGMIDGFDCEIEDDEEEASEGDYLDDIGEYVPGVSIKKD